MNHPLLMNHVPILNLIGSRYSKKNVLKLLLGVVVIFEHRTEITLKDIFDPNPRNSCRSKYIFLTINNYCSYELTEIETDIV